MSGREDASAIAGLPPNLELPNVTNSASTAVAAATQNISAPERPQRAPRPNYGQIHSQPLPLDIFPIPPFIPHNPVSLLHIAYVYLSHLISPPSSHPQARPRGWYDAASNSVHVTEPEHIRTLWEKGFFGKGSLSRSEPTWLERERKRLGLVAKDSAEEYTQRRRAERRAMKMERAKKEREAIEETLRAEKQGDSTAVVESSTDLDALSKDDTIPIEGGDASTQKLPEPSGAQVLSEDPVLEPSMTVDEDEVDQQEPENQEHLQLSSEEAFFLDFALGLFDVYDPTTLSPMTTTDFLTTLRSNSYFPPRPFPELVPYDPFLLSYVAYHHFRSLGWVVRPGLKFAVNWLLYLRGPVFAHAEFAVVVLPSFTDDYWWADERKAQTRKMQKKDWAWLHCLQRVQSQVQKGLIICFVEVPKPEHGSESTLSEGEREAAASKGMEVGEGSDIRRLLKGYKVREMAIRRWTPNRNRD